MRHRRPSTVDPLDHRPRHAPQSGALMGRFARPIPRRSSVGVALKNVVSVRFQILSHEDGAVVAKSHEPFEVLVSCVINEVSGGDLAL